MLLSCVNDNQAPMLLLTQLKREPDLAIRLNYSSNMDFIPSFVDYNFPEERSGVFPWFILELNVNLFFNLLLTEEFGVLLITKPSGIHCFWIHIQNIVSARLGLLLNGNNNFIEIMNDFNAKSTEEENKVKKTSRNSVLG